jgi:hypothetical protein
MMLAILKKNSFFICEPIMPMNYCAKHEILRNCCSCFAHHVKRLNVIASTTILLKSGSSILSSPNVATLIEAKTPNTPSSNVTNPTSTTSTKVDVILL